MNQQNGPRSVPSSLDHSPSEVGSFSPLADKVSLEKVGEKLAYQASKGNEEETLIDLGPLFRQERNSLKRFPLPTHTPGDCFFESMGFLAAYGYEVFEVDDPAVRFKLFGAGTDWPVNLKPYLAETLSNAKLLRQGIAEEVRSGRVDDILENWVTIYQDYLRERKRQYEEAAKAASTDDGSLGPCDPPSPLISRRSPPGRAIQPVRPLHPQPDNPISSVRGNFTPRGGPSLRPLVVRPHPLEAYFSQELKFLHNVVNLETTMKNLDRNKLANNMCNPHLYWGDEAAIKILQRGLKVEIKMYRKDAPVRIDPAKPLFLLHFAQDHYIPYLFVLPK